MNFRNVSVDILNAVFIDENTKNMQTCNEFLSTDILLSQFRIIDQFKKKMKKHSMHLVIYHEYNRED